jgi:hypothetical protein
MSGVLSDKTPIEVMRSNGTVLTKAQIRVRVDVYDDIGKGHDSFAAFVTNRVIVGKESYESAAK